MDANFKTVDGATLYAPETFWLLTPEQIKEFNGCGAGWLAGLVPDSILGVSVANACLIHDYMYTDGETIEDKKRADRVFLNNMVRIIKSRDSWRILENLRLWIAKRYYKAVKYFGGPAFWNGKTDPAP